uniref:Ubiquitin carboxyl-terminal hydrolase n=1 Tax=Percolomonas cosmopolitus TaxID=63605 RepID=A0A7S1KUR0_9EUKA
MSSSDWCLIESDPGVFTELIQKIGVKGVQVEEIFALDAQDLKRLAPVYGLIFLFKWQSEKKQRKIDHNPPNELFFAKQVVTNACATQAILSVLMNSPLKEETSSVPGVSEIQLGDTLSSLKEFTQEFDPELKGMTLGESESIRNAHNSFARPEPFVMERTHAKEDDECFHFIAYIPFEGRLYELDGLQPGPILLEENGVSTDNWLDKVVPHVQQRIQSYASHEIKFNLMAVCHDREQTLTQQRDDLVQKMQETTDESSKAVLETEIHDIETEIKQEQAKKRRWHQENVRRRHNYVPFLINLLKILASKGELEPMIEQAKQKKERSEQ